MYIILCFINLYIILKNKKCYKFHGPKDKTLNFVYIKESSIHQNVFQQVIKWRCINMTGINLTVFKKYVIFLPVINMPVVIITDIIIPCKVVIKLLFAVPESDCQEQPNCRKTSFCPHDHSFQFWGWVSQK